MRYRKPYSIEKSQSSSSCCQRKLKTTYKAVPHASGYFAIDSASPSRRDALELSRDDVSLVGDVGKAERHGYLGSRSQQCPMLVCTSDT